MLKKLILKLFVVALPTLTLFSVNLYLNLSVAEKLADNVVNGKISYTRANYNNRLVERKIIEKQQTIPETLILGTSPIAELSSSITGYDDQLLLCPGTGFFVDWLGILGLYKKQGRGLPKRLVWEPTATGIVRKGSNFYLTYGHVFKDTYAYFYDMKGIEKWQLYLEQITGLIKENLQFKTFFTKNFAFKVYDKKEDAQQPESLSGLDPDGHTIASPKRDEVPPAIPNTSLVYYDPDYYPEKMTQYFNDLKDFCTDNGIEFVILLPPVAPSFIDNFNTTHADENLSVESIEDYIRQLAGDCLVRGTFLSYDLNMTNADFLDEGHMRQRCLQQVWDYIK